MIIGSEGTLGFVSNVTLNIVVDYKYKALNLIYGNLDELINLTTKLQTFVPSSVDLLDYLSIKSVSSVAELQPFLIKLEDSQQSLEAQLNAVNQYIYAANILYQVGFRRDDQQMQT
ncbi:MAG: FAD-binding oxidoreductase, partial [Francisella endosymbiont of Hyalomma scupense]